MTNTKLEKNADNTFNVIDTRTGKAVKKNLRGNKAAAYRVYHEQLIADAELFWSEA